MANDPVAARYASTLFEVVQNEGRLDSTSRELEELAELIRQHEDLRQLLLNPDVEVVDKLQVLDRLLQGAWSQALRAFVQVALSMGRAAYLVDIAEAFDELVDEERGRARVIVRVVHPLSHSLKTQLKQTLEQLEQRQIELTEELAPELIGGIQVLVGHRMIDGSLRTQLDQLRQRLKSVRVH